MHGKARDRLCGVAAGSALVALSFVCGCGGGGGDGYDGDEVGPGSLAWAKRAGGTDPDQAWSVDALADGSFLVTGSFNGTATLGPGEINQTVLASGGENDVFVALYSPGGSLAWARSAGGANTEEGTSIAVLPDGSSLLTGFFESVAVFGQGEVNETTVISAGGYDVFVASYHADGSLAWVRREGGTDSDVSYSIAAVIDGSSLVTGRFSSSAVFGPGESNETVLASAGAFDIFIARHNVDGSLAWAKRAGGGGYDIARGIAAHVDGSSLITGYFEGTATFGAGEACQTVLTAVGPDDGFVARYNPDGSLAWARQVGGYGRAIAVLTDGSFLVTGCFEGSATFGQGEANETVLSSPGWRDIFVARYQPDGSLAWARRAGGDDDDQSLGIAALADGSAFLTGFFKGTATFGPAESNETMLTAGWPQDLFVARYGPDGTLVWAKLAGGGGNEVGTGIAALPDGSSLVTGYFLTTTTFGPGEINETLLTSAGNYDILIARYNP